MSKMPALLLASNVSDAVCNSIRAFWPSVRPSVCLFVWEKQTHSIVEIRTQPQPPSNVHEQLRQFTFDRDTPSTVGWHQMETTKIFIHWFFLVEVTQTISQVVGGVEVVVVSREFLLMSVQHFEVYGVGDIISSI